MSGLHVGKAIQLAVINNIPGTRTEETLHVWGCQPRQHRNVYWLWLVNREYFICHSQPNTTSGSHQYIFRYSVKICTFSNISNNSLTKWSDLIKPFIKSYRCHRVKPIRYPVKIRIHCTLCISFMGFIVHFHICLSAP